MATKSSEQLDLQTLHRVRERLVSQRTGIINQIRAFLLERGFAVRQGQRFLRAELPRILGTSSAGVDEETQALADRLHAEQEKIRIAEEKRQAKRLAHALGL